MVESPDGYLWLASPDGLIRFDGLSFERINALGGDSSLRSDTVRALCADASGGIWMGLGQDHGSALYKGGKFTRFKGRTMTRCMEVGGVTWLVANNRLARYDGAEITDVGKDWGLPDLLIRFVAADPLGQVIVFDAKGLAMWYLPQGEKRFRTFRGDAPPLVNVVTPRGDVWGAATAGMTEVAMESGVPVRSRWLSHKNMSLMLFDRDGGFWATDTEGLIHVGNPGDIGSGSGEAWRTNDMMTLERGIGSDVIWSLYEDKAGNVWLGTAAGLERFRNSALVPVKLPGRALAYSVVPAADGSVWAANWTSNLFRVDRHGLKQTLQLDPHAPAPLIHTGFLADPDGSVLAAAQTNSVWRVTPEGASPVGQIPADMTGGQIQAMARDRSGALWIGAGRSSPVVRYADGVWKRPAVDILPERWFTNAMAVDQKGRLWAAQRESAVLIEGAKGRLMTRQLDGLDVGDLQTISVGQGSARMWVGGSSGVAMFDGSRFHSLRLSGEFEPKQITGILESRSGDLWLHGRTDGFRVAASELKKFYDRPETPVSAMHLDSLDGLNGATRLETSRPNVVEASDGLIWFASTAGLAYFDPSRQLSSITFPKPQVQSVSARDRRWDIESSTLELPPLSTSVSIAFTAASLGIPERVRFKYRLDGVDQDWKESGNRRVASYNDLGPGDYRFHLVSTDETGRWGPAEASMNLSVPPAWFQTWTFRFVVAVTAVTLAWLAYRARVAQLTSRVRWQLKTQQAERDRIARDLHDTLLQGVQGLIWRFHTLARHLPDEDPVRLGMESALDSADAILARSRDRVQDLRGSIDSQESLVEALQECGDGLALDHSAVFESKVAGAERKLAPAVQAEVCYIAREAINNAFMHSKASRIVAEVDFKEREVEVAISDNGIGIDAVILQVGRTGHYGLTGMRERAQGLGAVLEVSSSSAGTSVVLKLGGAIAYAGT